MIEHACNISTTSVSKYFSNHNSLKNILVLTWKKNFNLFQQSGRRQPSLLDKNQRPMEPKHCTSFNRLNNTTIVTWIVIVCSSKREENHGQESLTNLCLHYTLPLPNSATSLTANPLVFSHKEPTTGFFLTHYLSIPVLNQINWLTAIFSSRPINLNKKISVQNVLWTPTEHWVLVLVKSYLVTWVKGSRILYFLVSSILSS